MNLLKSNTAKLDLPYQTGLIALAVFTASIALGLAIYYSKLPILEFHGFRQTQTAITSYWMMHEGWQFNYQTPVAGYPWSIPFEFPIYQSIVALIAYLGNFPLDPTGRFVSLAFLFLCVLPAFDITKKLELPPEVPWVFSSLLLSSPIYLFWGRTFMIETMATFFTFATISPAIDLFKENPRWRSVMFFMFWMTLGLLQKITTALPIMIGLALILATSHFNTFGLRLPNRRKTIQILVAFAVPIIIAGLWTSYSDVVRQQNILGMEMTSKALTSWNFGTLQQHFDLNIFKTIIWNRIFARNLSGYLGILLLGIVVAFGERRIKKILLISFFFFLLPIELFINLNLVHDYYQASSVIYIVGALAIAIVHFFKKIYRTTSVIFIFTLFIVVFNLYMFMQDYWPYLYSLQTSLITHSNRVLEVSSVLRKNTPENSVIVIFGMEWSSEVPYYAERKSFAIPDWKDRPGWPGKSSWNKKYQEILENPTPYLGGKEIGAIVYCGDRAPKVNPLAFTGRIRTDVSGCQIWMQ